ncbi:MAG: class I SAM-dependent methyltransferase [Chloroflexota bacterium]
MLQAPGSSLLPARPASSSSDLFERTAWLYAFLREHVFRDDTDLIDAVLWSDDRPASGTILLEVGCGPGVYARRLAARHSALHAVGIDASSALLQRARTRAAQAGLSNCHFEQGDALHLDWADASVDAVVVSRLFTVADGARVLSEAFRVLRPGGRCFVAEPASVLDSVWPMAALRIAHWFSSADQDAAASGSAPRWPWPLSADQFSALIRTQAWSSYESVRAGGYHLALCVKSAWGHA